MMFKMTKIALISLILGFRSGLILGYRNKRFTIRYLSSSSSSSSSSPSSLSSLSSTTTSSSSSSSSSSHAILKREYEEKLFNNGYRYIIGCDEAGRGPLAGPVVAAAVCLPSSPSSSFVLASQHQIIDTVRDSKLLSEKKREEIYNIIMNDNTIIKSFTVIDNDKIDEINILNAALLAMQLSIEKVTQQIQNDFITDNICALIDGNKVPKNMLFKTIPVVKGDQLVYSIALASIIAKVERDRIMTEMHNIYPNYDFIKHKGYPTKHHFLMLQQFGPCGIHRKSTKPVQRILYNKKEL